MSSFVWDPNANQTFTPADGSDYSPLTGPAASFDKTAGYGITTSGELSIKVSDGGTTQWGSIANAAPDQNTVFAIMPDSGSLTFYSPGKLIVGDPGRAVRMEIAHTNSPAETFIAESLILSVNEVVFSNVDIVISNGGSLEMVGRDEVDFSYMKIDNALIRVTDNSHCEITPNTGENSLNISNLDVSVTNNSWSLMDSINIVDGGTVKFTSIASSDDDDSYFKLYKFDFVKNNYSKSIFNFVTHNGNNKGSFTFGDIGNMFQVNAMIQKGLLAIDGNNDPNYIESAINYNSPDMFPNGDMYIRLK